MIGWLEVVSFRVSSGEHWNLAAMDLRRVHNHFLELPVSIEISGRSQQLR
jgi:hypothetical protein